MAEIVAYINHDGIKRPDPNYQHGDPIQVFNDDRIKCCHAENICHPQFAARNSDGLLVPLSVCEDFYLNTAEFEFDRVSTNEVKRITLSDMSEEIFSNVPSVSGEYMNVPEFIKRRIKHPKHHIFGTAGNEYWYGGRRIIDSTRLSRIWTQIETKTSKLESDHTLWPLTDIELKHFAVFPVNNFDNSAADRMVESKMDNTDPKKIIMIKKRNNNIDINNLPRISADTINKFRDPDIKMDMRKFANWDREAIIQVKA